MPYIEEGLWKFAKLENLVAEAFVVVFSIAKTRMFL